MTEILCKHYKGDGFEYKLGTQKLLLCGECEYKLMKQIFKQIDIERWLTLEISRRKKKDDNKQEIQHNRRQR